VKVLILGSGGREHALAWKIARSERLTELHAAPGNPGIAALGRCHPIRMDDVEGLLGLCRQHEIHLVVVGPEAPLGAGIADEIGGADIAIATPRASATAPARARNPAAPNRSSPVLPPKSTEFAPHSKARDSQTRKTRVVRYLFLATAGQRGGPMCATVCSYPMRKPVARHRIRECPSNGARSRAGNRWAFWSRR